MDPHEVHEWLLLVLSIAAVVVVVWKLRAVPDAINQWFIARYKHRQEMVKTAERWTKAAETVERELSTNGGESIKDRVEKGADDLRHVRLMLEHHTHTADGTVDIPHSLQHAKE